MNSIQLESEGIVFAYRAGEPVLRLPRLPRTFSRLPVRIFAMSRPVTSSATPLPAWVARKYDVPVHVIFFGLPAESDEDAEALRAIADASGGRFLHARSGQELFDALVGTVGTAYSVHLGDREVSASTLGAEEPVRL